QGRLQEAVAEREAEVAIYQDMLATEPRNGDARGGLMIAEYKLGNLSLSRGQVPLALSQARRATTLAQALLADDPDNAVIALDSAIAYGNLGEILLHGGDADGARAAMARSRELAQALVERDPGVLRWQAALARALLLQTFLADADPLDALRTLQGIVQRLQSLPGSPRPERALRELQAQCRLAASERHLQLGDRARAEEEWRATVDLVRATPPLAGPRAEAMLAAALQSLGRTGEARP